MYSTSTVRRPQQYPKPLRALLVFGASLMLFAFMLTLVGSPSRASSPSQSDGSAIAYISSSTDNQEIRMIEPDGSNDQLLWRVPSETASHDGIGLGAINWHPEATELAFDSGHDWQRSLNIRDLYAVTSDGQSLRRISRPPSPDAYDQFATGTVHFTLDMLELGDVQIYIEGMEEPYKYFARADETWTFTMTNVADFGDNFRQYMRIIDQGGGRFTCHFNDVFAWVDVVPDTFTRVGEIDLDAFLTAHSCPRIFNPSWTHDGSALHYIFYAADTVYSESNLWQIPHTPATTSLGERLFDLENYIFRGNIYRVVSGPTEATAHELFFLESQVGVDVIVYMSLEDPTDHRSVDLGLCPRGSCDILDLEWLPDGSGLFFSRYESGFSSSGEPPVGGVLYHLPFDTWQHEEILRLPNEAIGNLSVSPDGTTVVFERSSRISEEIDFERNGPELECPCALWTVENDGTDLRLLTGDGRQPAWSPVAPSVAVQQTATATPIQPTATPIPSFTATPPSGAAGNLPPQLWLPYIHK